MKKTILVAALLTLFASTAKAQQASPIYECAGTRQPAVSIVNFTGGGCSYASGVLTLTTGGGGSTTLQGAYNNGPSGLITLTSGGGALTLRDATVALGTPLLQVQSHSGGTTYFSAAVGQTLHPDGLQSGGLIYPGISFISSPNMGLVKETATMVGLTPNGVDLISIGAGSGGDATLESGDYTLRGNFNQSSGAIGITATAVNISGSSDSRFSTSAGAITIDAAGSLGLGLVTATGISIGHTAATTSVTGQLHQSGGIFSLTGSDASSITTAVGNTVIDSAAVASLGGTTATATTVGRSGGLTTTLGAMAVKPLASIADNTDYTVDFGGANTDFAVYYAVLTAAATVTLPAAAAGNAGRILYIKKNSLSGALTIAATGNIDGSATQTTATAHGFFLVISTGSTWLIMSQG